MGCVCGCVSAFHLLLTMKQTLSLNANQNPNTALENGAIMGNISLDLDKAALPPQREQFASPFLRAPSTEGAIPSMPSLSSLHSLHIYVDR